eukprot:tig00020904_g15196.t1
MIEHVSAEVYARFGSKTYRDGTSVVGIKTRDYEHKSTECQVLVTVPAMLEIMLMSPVEAVQAWCRRIRFVILDEVHCIGIDPNVNRESGASEGGAVWERVLLLIRCPFLALSATISSPGDLCAWMAQKHGSLQRKVELVQFDVRYSDLRKHVYVPSGAGGGGSIRALHPFAALSGAKMRRGGIPRDMALAPEESLQLYEALCAAGAASGVLGRHPEEARALRDLDPDVFFTADLIDKARAREFEAAAKAVFERWARAGDGGGDGDGGGARAAEAEAALARLAAGAEGAFRALEEQILLQDGDAEGEGEGERGGEGEAGAEPIAADSGAGAGAGAEAKPGAGLRVRENFLGLLRCLQGEEKLPAIGFCFDRSFCEELVLWTSATLEAQEAAWRSGTPEGRRRVAERRRAAEERRAARAALEKQLARSKDRGRKDEIEQSGALEEAREGFEEEEGACEDEFTFVRRAEGLSPKEYAEFEGRLQGSLKADAERYRPLLAALRRGLGVHHAGLNKKFREAVEVLFRRRHLKVVLATGTLALGINMPCRTPLIDLELVSARSKLGGPGAQYRQTSGRAGRRGFDDLGHVVFFGLSRSKVDRLLTADIPRIRGQFPMTASLVLRAMCLYSQAGLLLPPGASGSAAAAARARCAERAADLVLGLFRQPLFSAGRAGHPDQVYHHVRYSLELLRRGRLLARDGGVLGLAGLCQHLSYTEPANLAFAHLARCPLELRAALIIITRRAGRLTGPSGSTGALHALLEEAPTSEEGRRRLLTVLAHLFCTLPQPVGQLRRRRVAGRPSPSLVRLPPLPPRAAAALRDYNRGVLAASGRPRAPLLRPARPRLVRGRSGLRSGRVGRVGGAGSLPAALRFAVRSPFAALAGRGDAFESAEELAACVREGVALEAASVPALPGPRQRAARGLALNAYLLDFYTHGQREELVAANRLRHGDVWFALNDFELVLKAISRSLERLVPGGEEEDDAGPEEEAGGARAPGGGGGREPRGRGTRWRGPRRDPGPLAPGLPPPPRLPLLARPRLGPALGP